MPHIKVTIRLSQMAPFELAGDVSGTYLLWGLWPCRCPETGPLGSERGAESVDSMIRVSHSPKKVDTGASACSETLVSGPSHHSLMPTAANGCMAIFH